MRKRKKPGLGGGAPELSWEQPGACLQPENRPVWLSLFVLYGSTRPGRHFIVAITQIPLAFIPSLDASGLYSITVSIYRWKKNLGHMRNTSNKRIPYFEKTKKQKPQQALKRQKRNYLLFLLLLLFTLKTSRAAIVKCAWCRRPLTRWCLRVRVTLTL